jgi:hypothetical protein
MFNDTLMRAYKFISLKIKISVDGLLLLLFLSGCVTTNYYTGRTLDNGCKVMTPGVDNLVLSKKMTGFLIMVCFSAQA